MTVTNGTLLGGRILYTQPAKGFRSGLEPVLLAASVPARPGDRVLEAGTGAGAALLCLTARVTGVIAVGVELDETAGQLAESNAAANRFDTIAIRIGRIETQIWETPFDHVLANPPYHPPDGARSPVPALEVAKRGSAEQTETWIRHLAAALRARGTMTLIVPAWLVPACLSAMQQHGCPCTALYPLWPKHGRAAKLVMLRGIRTSRTPMRLLPGLVLHQADGTFTPETNAILTLASPLALAPGRHERN